jgi:hypothetical protein
MMHLFDLVAHLHIKETITNIQIVHHQARLMREAIGSLHPLTPQLIMLNSGHTTQDIHLYLAITDRDLPILPAMKEETSRGIHILQA